jgi:hypothetical protein
MLGKKRKTTTRYKQKRNELKNKKTEQRDLRMRQE